MGDNTDFNTLSLDNFDAVLQSLPDDDQNIRANLYSYFAIHVFSRFQRWGQILDLKEAIEKVIWALQGTTLDDEEYVGRLNNLRVMLESRFKRIGKIEDLEKALQIS